MKKIIKAFTIIVLAVAVCMVGILGVNEFVKYVGGKNIISAEETLELEDVDCILVLGCGVRTNGKPSIILSDRLKKSVELYKQRSAPKIIMSGDHGTKTYDEVNTMKSYAIKEGVPSKNIFMDHAGFSTYESMYRAKEIFEADKIIIVTQEYHLYRALYIAKMLGTEAYGVSADHYTYSKQTEREVREILARCKDFITTIYKPEPKYLGEPIPVSGNGNATNG